MVKKLVAVLMLAAVPAFIFGQTIEDFDNVVDFSISIRELATAAKNNDTGALPRKLVIVDGTVASRLVVDANPESYIGQLELVGGEWIGVETVVTYRCFLLLEGSRFANAIPVRRTRTKNPEEIDLNSRILVVGEFLGLYDMEDGTTVAVLNAYHIRKID